MKTFLTIFAVVLSIFCFGQNLVPNGDFESYDDCPTAEGFLSNASPWINFANLSPDYYNECASGTTVDVPDNNAGNQVPSSGNGYAGVFASQIISDADVREYISIQLIEPLQTGTTYMLQFNVSLADVSNQAITTMGAYFSISNDLPLNNFLVDVIPQVVNETESLTETTNWMTISGLFIAQGDEQFLTIGNFENDNNCGIQEVSGGLYDVAYYFIDDVSLSSVTSIEEFSQSFSVYPNPFKDNFKITSTDNQQYELVLYDVTGRVILKKTYVNSTFISTKKYAEGVYYYELQNDNTIVKKGKIVKQ